MLRRLWPVVALLAWLWAPAVAQQREVLVLPVEMPAYYNPMDSEALTTVLQQSLARSAPMANIQVSRAADLTAYGYRAGGDQPPGLEMAAKICAAYGANSLVWVSIRFHPDYDPDSRSLALAGAARFWGYSAAQGQVVFDQPLSLVRVGQVANADDELGSKALARSLAQGCVQDLGLQIAAMARQRAVQPPAAAASWTAPPDDPTHSPQYRAMISATKAYQKAVREQDLVETTEASAAMTRAWEALSESEREAIDRNYPDIKQAMTPPDWVRNWNGWYY
jgi:hypothetical protein